MRRGVVVGEIVPGGGGERWNLGEAQRRAGDIVVAFADGRGKSRDDSMRRLLIDERESVGWWYRFVYC